MEVDKFPDRPLVIAQLGLYAGKASFGGNKTLQTQELPQHASSRAVRQIRQKSRPFAETFWGQKLFGGFRKQPADSAELAGTFFLQSPKGPLFLRVGGKEPGKPAKPRIHVKN